MAATLIKGMKFAPLIVLALAPLGQAGNPEYFAPGHRISGIGVARDDISQDLLEVRTDLMIQSQTFSIMREAPALAAARHITSDSKLQALFRAASQSSGVPASLLEAIAYLESWGDAKAESPSGPRGIMQISHTTAVSMGLRVVSVTRYKSSREKVPVKSRKGG